MNTSQKWLVAIGSALTLGTAAFTVHASTGEQSGTGQQMQGGMHRGMQDGKGPGAKGQNAQGHGAQGKGEHRMSSEKRDGHQHGNASAEQGQHRQMAEARGAGRGRQGGGDEKHQHGQGKGTGGHSH